MFLCVSREKKNKEKKNLNKRPKHLIIIICGNENNKTVNTRKIHKYVKVRHYIYINTHVHKKLIIIIIIFYSIRYVGSYSTLH